MVIIAFVLEANGMCQYAWSYVVLSPEIYCNLTCAFVFFHLGFLHDSLACNIFGMIATPHGCYSLFLSILVQMLKIRIWAELHEKLAETICNKP